MAAFVGSSGVVLGPGRGLETAVRGTERSRGLSRGDGCRARLVATGGRSGRVAVLRNSSSAEIGGEIGEEIEPLSPAHDSPEVNLKRAAGSFTRSGWTAFWLQLALSIVASVILVFALAFPGVDSSAGASLFSQALISLGAFASFVSTLWTLNYTRIGQKCRVQIDANKSTIKANSIKNALRVGLLIAVVGMLSCIIGLQATTGTLLSRLLTQSYSVASRGPNVIAQPNVQPIDIFVIQAAANALLSLLLALILSLWLSTQYKAAPAGVATSS